jgi:two-component system, LytTR family, sensor kinase
MRVPARLWFLILAGCVIAGVLDALQTVFKGVLEGKIDWSSVVFQGSEWLFLALLTLMTFFLGQRYPIRKPNVVKPALVHLAGAALLCVGWAGMGVLLRRLQGDGWGGSWQFELLGWTLTSVPWSFFMYFAVLGTVHAFAYYVEARDRELQTSQLTGQLSEARLQALRAQLQPHFLFNTLNAITVLVRDQRTPMAVTMLDRLSELLRQVLRSDQQHQITLSEELQLVRLYLDIEQVRFSDRLRVTISAPEDTLGALVPTLMLQPLVENAVRHGLLDRTDNALIEIRARRIADRLELSVRDNGRGLTAAQPPGVGLENTRARLAALYGEAATLELGGAEGGGTLALVRLPFANQPVRNPAE